MSALLAFSAFLAAQAAPPPMLLPPLPPGAQPAERARPHASYFSRADYPAAARSVGAEGTVYVRLAVGANGRVTNCAVTRSTGHPALDSATCRILRSRARYAPARNQAGDPVEGVDIGWVRWSLSGPIAASDPDRDLLPAPPPVIRMMPPPPPVARVAPGQPGVVRPPLRARTNLGSYFSDDDYPAAALRAGDEGIVRFRLAIGGDGRVSNCVITASSGSAALDSATCRILRSRARYSPARDAAGAAVPGSDSGAMRWILPPAQVPAPESGAATP